MSGQGERGRDGAIGAEGRAGTTGKTGSAGATGTPGATGATGPIGPRARHGAIGFLILMTFNFFGFVHVDRESERALQADRDGCARANVLRLSQAQVLEDQIKQTAISLKGNLGVLEPFRDQLEEGLVSKRTRLRRLRESVADHPVNGRPYDIDCVSAYP